MEPSGQVGNGQPRADRRLVLLTPPQPPRHGAAFRPRPRRLCLPTPADPGQVALDAETIQHLHSTLRALPRPLLESLTRGRSASRCSPAICVTA